MVEVDLQGERSGIGVSCIWSLPRLRSFLTKFSGMTLFDPAISIPFECLDP